ncbi:MAG: hypothetical protein V3V99_02855 [candidate division Zixibacteria bacterium]
MKRGTGCVSNHHRFDMTKNVNLRKQTHFYRKCGHMPVIESLAKNPGHLCDSQKGMTSPTVENRLSPVDMTQNVNLRKQTHFSSKCGHMPGIKSLAKNPGHLRDSQKGMTSPTAKNRPSPEKGQNEPNSV